MMLGIALVPSLGWIGYTDPRQAVHETGPKHDSYDRESCQGGVSRQSKSDFNAYLDAHSTAPVRSLAEVVASKKYHHFLQNALNGAEAVESCDTKDSLEHVVKIGTVREAVLARLASIVNFLPLPVFRRSWSRGLTPDGIPVGVEFMGRPWNEPQLINSAYCYEPSTRHRRPPASTPPFQ
jgi:hypothetical protein